MALRSVLCQLTKTSHFFQTRQNRFLERNFFKTTTVSSMNVIEFESLQNKLKKGEVVLVDVREPSDIKTDGKIPNSVNIPLGLIVDTFSSSSMDLQNKYGIEKSSSLVVSCRSGKRAVDAYQKLESLGYKHVQLYKGSFLDWEKNGGNVEK